MSAEPLNPEPRPPAAAAPAKPMGQAASRGIAVTGIAQAAKVVISMTSIVIVARILAPSDYGVIAMAQPIATFILIFQNLGLSQATVQARSISDGQIKALFLLNIATSAAIAVTLVALAWPAALLYGDVRAGYVVAASALTVLVTGLALQHSALLIRDMRFTALSTADVAGNAATLVTTLACALWLRSYWALWLGGFMGAVVSTALIWRASRWRPRGRADFTEARQMMRFGAGLTGFNLLNYFSRNLDNVLIAKMWGPAALGLYDRSYKIMMFPIQNLNAPLGRVIYPVLARARDEPERFRRIYLRVIRTVCLVSVPGMIAAAACSGEVIPLLLGPRWAAASPIFFWLSLVAIQQPVTNATNWLFISCGRTREMFRWGLIAAPVTVLSFFIGLPWGAVGVAQAYFVGQLSLVPLLFRYCTRDTPVSAGSLCRVVLPTLLSGIPTWGAVTLLRPWVSPLVLVICAVALSYLFATAIQASAREGRATLSEMFGLARRLIGRRGATA